MISDIQHTFYASTTPYISTITPNPFTTNSIALTRSTWTLSKIKSTTIIRKIQRTTSTNNTINIKHYHLPLPELRHLAPLAKCLKCKHTYNTNTNQQYIIALNT